IGPAGVQREGVAATLNTLRFRRTTYFVGEGQAASRSVRRGVVRGRGRQGGDRCPDAYNRRVTSRRPASPKKSRSPASSGTTRVERAVMPAERWQQILRMLKEVRDRAGRTTQARRGGPEAQADRQQGSRAAPLEHSLPRERPASAARPRRASGPRPRG